jgi:long-chain acyl-CoA synthetase
MIPIPCLASCVFLQCMFFASPRQRPDLLKGEKNVAIKFNNVVRHRDLRELVDYAADKYGDKAAYREFNADRQIIEHTFNQLKADTEALGAKLTADGHRGKHFALIGHSTYNYVVSYLATVNWVGVIVPIDRELTSDDIIKLLHKCDAEAIFFADPLCSDMPYILEQCPAITLAINITPSAPSPVYKSLPDLVMAGRELLSQGNDDYLVKDLDVNKMCTILFTSGTTGANKGVMLNHRNITTCVYAAMSLFKPRTSFSVLPINHSYEFNIHVLVSISGGATLCFNSSLKHVKDDLLVYQPYMSLMVPMIVEGLYKNIWKETEKAGLTAHLKQGIWFSNLIRKIGIDKRRLFFDPIHKNLGGDLHFIVCGGAPLNPELVKGFDALGVAVYNGYGITECSPLISSNSPLYNLPGSVGVIVPGCEVRVGGPVTDGIGEIQVKGDNVMLGYYKDENATHQSFTEDGWFRTGDLGYLNKKGVLYITGRAKNLIILPNGKNVHPEEIEEHLINSINYVKEAVVFAQSDSKGNDCVITAAAYLDEQFIQDVGIERARQIFEDDIQLLNKRLAAYKRINRTMLWATEFEKTTTKKIKREAFIKEVSKNA